MLNLVENEEPSLAVRVGPLDTAANIRRELARLYRAARRASGPSPDASSAGRLAFILGMIQRSIEADELTRRVEAVEAELKRRLT
jgi:hypothetical protein